MLANSETVEGQKSVKIYKFLKLELGDTRIHSQQLLLGPSPKTNINIFFFKIIVEIIHFLQSVILNIYCKVATTSTLQKLHGILKICIWYSVFLLPKAFVPFLRTMLYQSRDIFKTVCRSQCIALETQSKTQLARTSF